MELKIERPKTPKRPNGLRTLNDRIEILRELRADMPIHMVSVFLAVAMKPGVLQCDLPDIINLSQSSISRNIYALGKHDRHGKPGLGLVVQRCGLAGARSPEIHLTKAGRELAKRLMELDSPTVR
jgi:DNA-binding MarR family transcriptional regulator